MFSNWFQPWVSCQVGGAATFDCLGVVFSNLVSALILFVGLTALIMFIFAAYRVINSNGDPKKLESARDAFGYGLLGLSVVAFSFLIIRLIARFTGTTCITRFFGC